MINFGCAPKNVDHLVAMVVEDMKALAEKGPDADDLLKFKAAYEKAQETALLDNSFWVKYLAGQLQDTESILAVLDTKKDQEQLTLASLKDAAKRYLTGKNMITFELLPEEAAK
jgi:zinc protease